MSKVKVKTPNNLNDLNKALKELGFISDLYNGKSIVINEMTIGYDSTKELWGFNENYIPTKELKNYLRDKNKMSDLLNYG